MEFYNQLSSISGKARKNAALQRWFAVSYNRCKALKIADN
jgi:hypothetical protein